MVVRNDLRNIAIVAHVDHGKTTLVDSMFRQSGLFRENQQLLERALDSNELEQERGITILAKNTSVKWKDVRINIVDTPGHADFGGEVERVLSMVNGVLVLVDAAEGPMPQTRFVLSRALALSLPLVIVINKADRPEANCRQALDDTMYMLMELGANDEQVDSPVIYASGRDGRAGLSPDNLGGSLADLFDTIIGHLPCPQGDEKAPLQMQVSTIDYNDYVGRIAVGRIERGTLDVGDSVVVCRPEKSQPVMPTRISSMIMFEGLSRVQVQHATVGDIVAISGIEGFEIGDTLCSPDAVDPLPVFKVSEPTVIMTFHVNNGPYAGQEGTYVTSRHIWNRLFREAQADVALHVEQADRADSFKVSGRGELHLSILVEKMRREGYEFMVSKPEVIVHEGPDGKEEPIERLYIDVPEEYFGTVMDKLTRRKAELIDMKSASGRVRLEFFIASRTLFGYRSEMLTDTRGEGIMNSAFDHYGKWRGDVVSRRFGVLVATENGESVAYSLNTAQKRGQLFIGPGEKVYCGMIIGLGNRSEDIAMNVCKGKKLTNMRASGKDDNVILSAPRRLSLEEALLFIDDDELVEITPKNFRLRKRILDTTMRLKAESREKD